MAATASMGRVLLDKGHELREAYSNLLEQRNANRRSLRDLHTQELLTPDESDEVTELYPPRQKGESEDTFED